MRYRPRLMHVVFAAPTPLLGVFAVRTLQTGHRGAGPWALLELSVGLVISAALWEYFALRSRLGRLTAVAAVSLTLAVFAFSVDMITGVNVSQASIDTIDAALGPWVIAMTLLPPLALGRYGRAVIRRRHLKHLEEYALASSAPTAPLPPRPARARALLRRRAAAKSARRARRQARQA